MKRASTPSFIATFGLHYEPWQRDKLDKLFQVDNNIYNALVNWSGPAPGAVTRLASPPSLRSWTRRTPPRNTRRL